MEIEKILEEMKKFFELLRELEPVAFEAKKLEFRKPAKDLLEIRYPVSNLFLDEIKTIAKYNVRVGIVAENNTLYIRLTLPLF